MQGPVLNLQTFARGLHCRVFSFEFHKQPLVLRVAHHGSHILKEWQAHRYLGAVLPVPVVLKEGILAQQYWAIVARCRGQALADAPFSLAQNMPHETIIEHLLKLHSHVVLYPSRGFGPLDWQSGQGDRSWLAYLKSVFGQSHKTLASDSLFRASDFEAYYSHLISLLPDCPSSGWVIHGDFKAQNLLVEQGRVTGIVDWSGLGFGDFLYDLAVYAFYLPAQQRQSFLKDALIRYQQSGFDLRCFEQRLTAYMIHSALGILMTLGQRQAIAEFDRIQQALAQILDTDNCFPVALNLS